MNRFYSLFIFSLVFLTAGCGMETYEDVDAGQERWVYLVQNGTDNGLLTLELDAGTLYNGYLGVYCSGIGEPDRPVAVTLALDPEKAAAYNEQQQADGAPAYEDFPEGALQVTGSAVIPAGEVSALIPVRIDPVLLKKNKSYLFVVTLQTVSAYAVKPELESLYVCVKLK